MECLIKLQLAKKEMLEKFFMNYKKDGKDRKTPSYYAARLKMIESHWEDIKTRHNEIITLKYSTAENEAKSFDYFEKNIYTEIEEFYIMAYSRIVGDSVKDFPEKGNKISVGDEDIKSVTVVQQSAKSDCLKLPRIELPKFSGDYKSWPSFNDLFSTLVDKNESLSKVQKLQYLKMHLGGEAEQLLRHFQITENNYDSAWKLLVERYDNKRVLVDAHMKTLFSQHSLSNENSQGIKNLLDTTTECLQALSNLDIDISAWDPVIVYITVQKLPTQTHLLWEQDLSKDGELPTWVQLKDFLERRFRTLEAITSKNIKSTNWRDNRKVPIKLGRHSGQTFHLAASTHFECYMCQESHDIRHCPKFLNLDQPRRLEVVKSKGLCINCLERGHRLSRCSSKRKCTYCHRSHHSLLHKPVNSANYESSDVEVRGKSTSQDSGTESFLPSKGNDQKITPSLSATTPSFQPKPSTSALNSYFVDKMAARNTILLATALVKVTSINGHECMMRALLDPGSQASFVTENAVQRLRLKKKPVCANISGLGLSRAAEVKSKVTLTVHSAIGDSNGLDIESFVLHTLTDILPSKKIPHQHFKHIQGLELADPHFYKPGRIDLLLGADVHASIILDGVIKGEQGDPIAQRTIFGWVLIGEVSNKVQQPIDVKSFHLGVDLHDQLKKFWEIEEVKTESVYTEEEERCEQHFQETYRRLSNGRYEVRLPFIDTTENLNLGQSRNIAIARLCQMENKFKGNPGLYREYSSCIQEYLKLGHMVPASSTEREHLRENNGKVTYSCCYLPHHAVMKEHSTTTKLRVVFDASRKTSSNRSLNDVLLKGPTIQDDLSSLLLRWRKHRIAFMSDVEKMYRQIAVNINDANYQRIVWRNHPDTPITDYILRTVTFGTKSAPFLATRTIKQLAMDENDCFPLGADAIANDMYVDDLISGEDTVEMALQKQNQIIGLMNRGKFHLRKWASNSTEILENVCKEDREIDVPLNINFENDLRALGILWNPSTDEFIYKINFGETETVNYSKRLILSEVAKLYDPLGWIAPITIIGKIIMQKLWLAGLNWDEPVSEGLALEWHQYRNSLNNLATIRLPRWINFSKTARSVEMQGFCDASQKAYAAVIYVCVTDSDGRRHVSMLTAKAKVAPVKTVSLPKLELCGAELLAKLIKSSLKAIKFPSTPKIYCWTDSKIVLAWLREHPSKWNTFVANRVSNIHEMLGKNTWEHVASKNNPADCATRGLTASELREHELWWKGPKWLHQASTFWPIRLQQIETDLELRKVSSFHNCVEEILELSEKYSSLSKLCRITAYCKRFIKNLGRSKSEREMSYLKADEIKQALFFWIKQTQRKCFWEEICLLKAKKQLSPKSKLVCLHPFLDTDEIIRVGGRLRYAEITFEEKHPIILPGNVNLTRLIIRDCHATTLHGGPQLMIATLRKRYWILSCRNAVKQCIYSCIPCQRQKATTRTQLMGDLPAARVRVSQPFSHSGVDYCGPFEVRSSRIRGAKLYKAYIAIFVCLATKAIHIEIVSDLSAEGFLAAFRRFVSRRGMCSDLYSDCGSNFIGANRILTKNQRRMIESIDNEIAASIATQGVEWHFVPPASPHFGGLWEAGVKSVKHHLKRILGQSKLTYEEFHTITTQIEGCLNSRPLCELSNDPNDLNPLTPGHFLIGRSILTPSEPSILDTNLHRLDRWHVLQHLLQTFWRRWSMEYLNRLQQRPKWNRIESNVEVGDLVLVKHDNLPPTRWLLARVVQTHPGEDGLVRVVTLKTKEASIQRPITKICVLPVKDTRINHIN